MLQEMAASRFWLPARKITPLKCLVFTIGFRLCVIHKLSIAATHSLDLLIWRIRCQQALRSTPAIGSIGIQCAYRQKRIQLEAPVISFESVLEIPKQLMVDHNMWVKETKRGN